MRNRGASVLPQRADWVGLLEALYAPHADDKDWGRGVVDALGRAWPFEIAGGAIVVLEHNPDLTEHVMPFIVGEGRFASFSPAADLDSLGSDISAALFGSSRLAFTLSEVFRVSPRGQEALDDIHRRWGSRDCVGLMAHPEPGVAACLGHTQDKPTSLASHERRTLSQIALHLESAWRLRRRPEAVLAVLAPDGKLLHREHEAFGAPAVGERVRRIDRSRTRALRRTPAAMDLWSALVSGEASIVERYDGSKRFYVVLENPPSHRVHRALTRREVEVVRMAARGIAAKLIAYGLGLSPAAVSQALANAAAKLGMRNRLALLRVASTLSDTPAAPVDAAKLSSAEQEIFAMVREGLSNRDIAERRARSERTVANQVAAILRKTGSTSRRAIVAARS